LKVEQIAKLKEDMPQKATRKSLKVKFISNDDIWKYMKSDNNDSEDEDGQEDDSIESQDVHFDLNSKK